LSDKRLITCRECDRMFRLRHGTASATYHANRLPGRWTGKPTKGRLGKTLLVSVKYATELFDATFCRKAG
jgi:hypothetical protein